ncbi:hypothetical protein RhiirC2_799926 [Rhizophagus irregularis]|uniref:Uncharacterized protein n=1 Tax=Rhizophagus irregularis TaxID=588596 RepID=A0A2N1M498_9GLOM|nr:hypothetical protein RhiirC2_799926 [Rhizophagus irregularis]
MAVVVIISQVAHISWLVYVSQLIVPMDYQAINRFLNYFNPDIHKVKIKAQK